MAHVKDENEEGVVRVTILIKNFKIHVLFDTGGIQSFIKHRIVNKLTLKTSTLPYPLRIVAEREEPEFITLGV